MATNRSALGITSSLDVIRDTDTDETAENDVNDGAATIYLIQIDNSANASAASYLKLYNAASPTVGTTAPDIVIMAPGGATVKVAIGEGISFGTALSMAAVTTAGTGGTTGPSSAVVTTVVAG